MRKTADGAARLAGGAAGEVAGGIGNIIAAAQNAQGAKEAEKLAGSDEKTQNRAARQGFATSMLRGAVNQVSSIGGSLRGGGKSFGDSMAGTVMAGVGGTPLHKGGHGGHGGDGSDVKGHLPKDAEGKTKSDRQLQSKNAQERIKGAMHKAFENYQSGMSIRDSLKSGISSLAQANRDALPANWNKSDALRAKEAAAEKEAAKGDSGAGKGSRSLGHHGHHGYHGHHGHQSRQNHHDRHNHHNHHRRHRR